jgi:hypothetical protein
MSAPLIVVVLVAVGDAHDPSVVSMTTSAEEALGPDAIVVVRETPSTPSDGDALALGGALHADALVEVSWPDADRRRALLHVHPSKDAATWSDREIDFAPNDATPERGRTLGFAVASMIPAPSAPTTATTTTTSASPTVKSAATPNEGATSSNPMHAEAPPTSDAAARVALEILGVASAGVGGNATAYGGEVGARFRIANDLALRIGGGVRFGTVPEATATSSTARIDAGIAWDFAHAASRRFAFGVRVDAVVLRHALARTDRDEQGVRWIPGVDAFLEAAWSFTSGGAVVLGVGPEVAFGTTHVVVGDATVESIPPVRLLATLGLRARF